MLFVLAAVGFVALAFFGLIVSGKSRPKPSKGSDSHYKAVRLFTKSESSFYFELVELLPQDYVVFCKVRIADLVKPVHAERSREYYQAFNRISRKHVDYVICHKQSLDVALLVELDDASHARMDRRERDIFLNDLFCSCGLPLLRVPISGAGKEKALTWLRGWKENLAA